jgi:hypothetical protein
LVSLGYKYELRPEKDQLPADPLPENTCQIVRERLKNFPQEIVIVKPTFPESYPDWWIEE